MGGKKTERCDMPAGAPGDTCDASKRIMVECTLVKNEVNEFNTRLCSYLVTLKVEKPASGIWVTGYKHKADIWEKTESREWTILKRAEANQDTTITFEGYVNIYNDPDAQGPTLLTLERVAGVTDSPECEAFRSVGDYLDEVAVKIPQTCP